VPELYFSPDEIRLIHDHRIFDIKSEIVSKITILFSGIEEEIRKDLELVSFDFPENSLIRAGKISKGENYLNCPYLVLDYPRLFSKADIFSFRTIFWWGHYLSNAFIIGGRSYHQYISHFIEGAEKLKNTDWHLCVHDNPWRLEMDESNFRSFKSLSIRESRDFMKRYTFLKIARIYPVDHFDRLASGTKEFTSGILRYLA
jgi:hypothetical protein